MAKATSKAANVTKAAKKAGKAAPTFDQMVRYCADAFRDMKNADKSLQDRREEWRAARQSIRTELRRAADSVAAGKNWDHFLAALRRILVKEKVCPNNAEASQVIRNQLKAAGLTGRGIRAKRKSGQPEKTETGGAKEVSPQAMARQLHRVTAHCAAMQELYAGKGNVTRASVLLQWGKCAALANPDATERKRAKKLKVNGVDQPDDLNDSDAAELIRDALNSNGTIQ